MKKFLLSAMLLTSALAMAQQREIRIGVEGAYPPFSETKADGSVVGFDIDIAQALCDDLKAKCTFVKQDWDGMIPALASRRYDAIVASMMITDERKEKVNFTNRYYSALPRLIAKKGGAVTSNEPEKLSGKRVGVQRGTISEKYATRFWEPKGVTVVGYAKQDEVYLDLVAGRLDAGLQDAIAADTGFLKRDTGKDFAFVGGPIKRRSAAEASVLGDGVGIAVRKDDATLQADLNKALEDVRKSGVYDSLSKKYFPFDIYGD